MGNLLAHAVSKIVAKGADRVYPPQADYGGAIQQ
jgi:hypothetical protein